MGVELFNKGEHMVVAFRDLVTGEGVQSNQFLIIDHDAVALLDPGGELTYSQLRIALGEYTAIQRLDYILVSHQDPDVVASIDKWLVGTDCRIVLPKLWVRFIAHFSKPHRIKDRLIPVPDQGGTLTLGESELVALPAHFLHSPGNFQFYDPLSRILFSGDMGANLCTDDLDKPATRLETLLPTMEGFHQRYMAGSRACRFWADMVASLDVELLVPQHGRAMQGKAIAEFLDWIRDLRCGVDLVDANWYHRPQESLQ